nr:T-complex protein 1 subunit delta [Ipomoea batatas]
MPLPAPASHAKLRGVRLQRKIRRGLLLRRGVTRSKKDFLRISSFNLLFLQFSKDGSAVFFFQSTQVLLTNLKRREAPNVTPTERSLAIPITVQSSPAKDQIANTKPSDQQWSPGRLKLSSTKLSSICFIRSLECGKYLGMFASRGIVRLSQNLVTNDEILRVDLLIDNLNSSYGSAEVVCDSESVSSGSGSFLTISLVMVFVYEFYAYPAYECFKPMELNKPDIKQLRLIEMQSFSVALHFVARFEFDRDDRKIIFNMINDLTGVEKAKNVVIQFQISLSKTDIEQSIVVSDYTQMDRSLKEEKTALIKSCFDGKGSATSGEMEDLVELEEQLIRLSTPELVSKAVKMVVGIDLIKMMNRIAVNRYKRFCKAALAAQIAAGPLSATFDMSAFESKYKDPSSIK